jgi:hypothetical protein
MDNILVLAAGGLLFPCYKDFEAGYGFLAYLIVAWGVVPMTLGFLVYSEKTRGIGVLLSVCFAVFALNRVEEMLAIWLVGPAMIASAFLQGIAGMLVGKK